MPKHPVSQANEQSLFGSLSAKEFYARHSVSHASDYITNSRGIKLLTQWWTPLPPTEIIGILSVVHGFTGESSWLVQLTSILFAQSGFATCAFDCQGHGYSDGLLNHIPDINPVVDDANAFFDSFRARHGPDLPAFLYSESLGGAISLHITLRQKGLWNGLILNGALCGISDKVMPPWPIELILSAIAWLVPTWRVVPTKGSLVDHSYKEEWKRKLVLASPRRRLARPTAGTAFELFRVCKELQERYEEVDVPLLICHGGADALCDPACVENLYKRASSEDKTLKIYPDMWHQLIGEPQYNVDIVFGHMVEWLRTRAMRHAKVG